MPHQIQTKIETRGAKAVDLIEDGARAPLEAAWRINADAAGFVTNRMERYGDLVQRIGECRSFLQAVELQQSYMVEALEAYWDYGLRFAGLGADAAREAGKKSGAAAAAGAGLAAEAAKDAGAAGERAASTLAEPAHAKPD